MGAGAPEITPEMIAAGEAVMSRVFEALDQPVPWSVMAAVSDVYIAMASKRGSPDRPSLDRCSGTA
jgi:hypothetical protein